ncbi:MAG: aminomethyl-transferring glycine dehydrogenase subunit GcvPA [Candidatus Alcyoniella australis]|nr:aminomethyl-transferring glycine dehydrogenase subunit GcvPA [Candidatus Alcyoniella australis]
MRYIPHTEQDVRSMLDAIGVDGIERLFEAIPKQVRQSAGLNLPEPLDEQQLVGLLTELADRNSSMDELSCFLGAGVYDHHVPTAIDQLLLRGEFFTAYTPYQPEAAQGTLQAIYEYQTMVCELTGMDVANASLYDGASALAEGVLMAARRNRKTKRTIISRAVHPEYRQTVQTYAQHQDIEFASLPFGPDGRADLAQLEQLLEDPAAGVVIQQPNALGVIEPLDRIAALINGRARLIVCVVEPLSLGLLEAPGKLGADIVLGEGASFGLAPGFGGPHLGFFAVRQSDVRAMPGRLCGATFDSEGNRGYVLTLATREQHIRREKATSNICTNQALCALAMTIYLTLLGPAGLQCLAQINYSKAEHAKSALSAVKGCSLPFAAPTFNEFVLRTPHPAQRVEAALRQEGILGGLPLERWYPEFENCLLVAATEKVSAEEISRYVQVLNQL